MTGNSRRIDPSDPRPIWRQIEDLLKREVALGRLSPGDAVPSVRDLARELRVNPNTVARAIQSLADAGVVETRRGDGTYVAQEQPEIARAERVTRLREEAVRFAEHALALGVRSAEALAAVETALQKLEKETRGRS